MTSSSLSWPSSAAAVRPLFWGGALAALTLVAACPKAPSTSVTVGDDVPAVSDDLDALLPVDARVAVGRLDNGLTYYVEPNAYPADRVELRLIVKAGSVLEDDDQLGLAHFVEHMAFNGTRSFPGTELVRFLEAVGMRFGAHVNASTGFDATQYQLRLPTDDPAVVARGFQVLRDWADGITFDPEECERERGVVLEEWRLGQGLGQRVRDMSLGLVFHGSRYAERLPIGTKESLETFDCAAAERFWRAWYRPDLMAVVAVGDLPREEMEALVRTHFGDLPAPAGARERTWYTLPDHDAVLTGVLADPELPQTVLSVVDKVDDIERPTHRAYRDFIVDNLLFFMLSERMGVVSQDPKAPFLGVQAGESGLGHLRAGQQLNVLAKEGKALDALTTALGEVERVRRFGFTAGELDRAKKEQARGLQAYLDGEDTTDHSVHADEIERVFLTDEPMPGIRYEYALGLRYLPTISLAEVNEAAAALYEGRSRVITVLQPAKEGLAVPDDAALRGAVAAVADLPLSPPADERLDRPLVSAAPTPGEVTEVGRDDVLGTITWRLGNGATVVLKPTDFQPDAVAFRGFSPGGTSVVEDERFIAAITATDLQVRSGLGEHDAITLQRLLAGRGAYARAYLADDAEGVVGGGSFTDLPTALQLVHLLFTQPRFDPAAFELELAGRADALRNRAVNPDAVAADTWADVVYASHPRTTAWRSEDLARMDLATSREVFRERFAIGPDWTFVFAGTMDLDRMRTLVATWLASIPGAGTAQEAPVDRGVRWASGVREEVVSAGTSPRTTVRLLVHGALEPGWASRSVLSALGDLVELRLREALREDRGGTYGVQVEVGSTEWPTSTWSLEVAFSCDPAREAELVAAMYAELQRLRAEGPTAAEVAAIQEQRRRDRETAVRTNSFWVGALTGAVKRGEDPREILAFDERNAALAPDLLRAMAAEVLDLAPDKLVLVQRPADAP